MKPGIVGEFGRAFMALALGSCLVACDHPGPPPDVLKTQREALERAKGVEATIQKADEAARQHADDASK
ncbi:MAG: hypothetical protein ABSF50_06895 [Burkholderiaceae bacterium]|jgi:hypothetical protein